MDHDSLVYLAELLAEVLALVITVEFWPARGMKTFLRRRLERRTLS